MEAFTLLFNHGTADLFLLAEHQRQREALDCFLDERPHLEMSQPRGEPLPDTLQATWKAYVYLDAVGCLASAANRVLLKQSSPTPAQIRTWDRFFVTASRFVDPCVAYRVGKTIVGVWRRPSN